MRRSQPYAEIAEVPYTAFAACPAHVIHGRLIVRRVHDLNPTAAGGSSFNYCASPITSLLSTRPSVPQTANSVGQLAFRE